MIKKQKGVKILSPWTRFPRTRNFVPNAASGISPRGRRCSYATYITASNSGGPGGCHPLAGLRGSAPRSKKLDYYRKSAGPAFIRFYEKSYRNFDRIKIANIKAVKTFSFVNLSPYDARIYIICI